LQKSIVAQSFYCLFFIAPGDFKPRNLKLNQTSSDCVGLDWYNPYPDVEANYQVYLCVVLAPCFGLVRDKLAENSKVLRENCEI